MANTNIQTIKTELANPEYASLITAQNYSGIANLLNQKPLIPNPVAQATVAKVPGILDLFGAIAPAEAVEIYKIPELVGDIRSATQIGDKAALQAYFVIASTLLSQQSQTAVTTLLNQVQPDPNYQSQIPGQSKAEQLGIYPVTPSQIQEALN